MTVKSKSQASLGVLPVRIQVDNKEVRTFALVDSGSNTTLVKRDLIDKLGIQGSHSPFSVNTLNGTQSHQHELLCKFQVSSDDRKECITVEALTVPDIPIQASSKSSFKEDWPHLRDINIQSVANKPIEIVIGTDCPEMFWSLDERRAGHKEPIARRTLLGWIVLGPSSQVHDASVNLAQVDPLQLQLNKMWNADFLDVKSMDPVMSVDDKIALKSMKDSVKLVDG